jgi:hypothetical protein
MKVRFSRHQGATTQPVKLAKRPRPRRLAGPGALGRERPSRLYSLLLPPTYPSDRR